MTPSFRQREQKILAGPVHSWRKCPACPHRQHKGVEDGCPGAGVAAEVFGAVVRSGGVGRVVGRLGGTSVGAVCLSGFPVGRVCSRSIYLLFLYLHTLTGKKKRNTN
jgi:hypothetical protein